MISNKANYKFTRFNIAGLLVLVGVLMTGCGGAGTGGGSKGGPASSYTIGGSITGLAGPVVLQDMGGDNLTVPADGKFTFAIPINNGNLYNVTVLTQPTGQTCSISSGSGIVSGNTVANVAIFCSSNTYTVGGTVSGLTGSVTLQINGNSGETLTLSNIGTYSFINPVAYGSPYSVTVLTQPSGNQTCSVSGGNGTTAGSGTVRAANITNINISCATSSYSIGGTVSNFNNTSLELLDNGTDHKSITTNGSFTFPTSISYNLPYDVTVLTQPPGQACFVAAGSGTAFANVSNILVTCGSLKGGGVQGNALSLPTGHVSTLAGAPTGADGTGAAARFAYPYSAVSDGTNLYVADTNNNKIRKIVIATKVVTTFAGSPNNVSGAADGIGTNATFYGPRGITTDGYSLYVTDTYNYKIRKIDIATATVSSLTGPTSAAAVYGSNSTTPATCGYACDTGATGAAYVTFSNPIGITYLAGFLYVTDAGNQKIRKVNVSNGAVTSFTGPPNAYAAFNGGVSYASPTTCGYSCEPPYQTGVTYATFCNPEGITTDGSNLYVADTCNNKIRMVTLSGTVSSYTGTANSYPPASGASDGAAASATFSGPQGITTDGVNLYVADTYNGKIRKVSISATTPVVSTLTGMMNLPASWGSSDGIGPAARFGYPSGITTDGVNLYVMDTYNSTIRAMTISPVDVTTLAGSIAGSDGTGASASFNYPRAVTTDGSNLYVADANANKIRKIVIATGAVNTIAGTGASGALDGPGLTATFYSPQGITTDGTNLYVADTYNNKIRQIDIATGVVSSLTGLANTAMLTSTCLNQSPWTCTINPPADGAAASALFYTPQGITTDGTNLYVIDSGTGKIREISPSSGTLASMTVNNANVSSLTGPSGAAAVYGGGTSAACGYACDTGAATYPTFYSPQGITTDGTSLYVADTNNNKIRKIVIATGAVSSLTGPSNMSVPMNYSCSTTCSYPNPSDSATATNVTFLYPQGITTDGTYLYVADSASNKIRKVDKSTGQTSSVTGTSNTLSAAGFADGTLANATFNYPGPITTDGGALYVIDLSSYLVRQIK
jgi:sugar lactone lactonase YvrE